MPNNSLHPALKPNWTFPPAPAGFPRICCFRYPDGADVLDFVNEDTRAFASEDSDVSVEWPWLEGFKPTGRDWEQAGFAFIAA